MLVYPLSTDPPEAANMLCDQHLKWMPNHISFLLASALERRGAKPLHYTEKLLVGYRYYDTNNRPLNCFRGRGGICHLDFFQVADLPPEIFPGGRSAT